MRIGRAATSIFIRGLIFLVVLMALASHGGQREAEKEDASATRAPAHLSSWVRASIGFVASLTVTVMLMVAISAPGASTDPDRPVIGLRGSISAE